MPGVVDGNQHPIQIPSAKIVNECSLPITGLGCVQRIITDLAVIDVTDQGLVLIETAPGVSEEDVRSRTEVDLLRP